MAGIVGLFVQVQSCVILPVLLPLVGCRWWEGVQVCLVTKCREVTAGVSMCGGISAYYTCGASHVMQDKNTTVVQYVSILLFFVHGFGCGFGE
jgi:hypothetical protein